MKYITVLLAITTSCPALSFCFDRAAYEFDVNAKLLEAICYTESTLRPHAINTGNNDGSTDYGLCQINTWWLPKLAKYRIYKDDLLNDSCLNTRISAWILAQNFETSGEGWLAVGAYNAGYKKENETARQVYIAKVKENLETLNQWDGNY